MVDPQTSTARSIRAGKLGVAISKPRLHPRARLVSANFPQEQERKPLGALSTVGEVYLNESRAPSESTVFPSDTLRTGETGAATFTASGRGSLKISPKARLSFVDDPRYLVTLHQGKVIMSVFGEAAKFQVRTGDFVVIPGPEVLEATSEVDRSADGSSRITCTTGAVGVIALERTEAVFLRPGQYVTVSAEGKLEAVMPPLGVPSETTLPPRVKKAHTGWIILGVAGGGGAAVAVASRGQKAPVSPSSR